MTTSELKYSLFRAIDSINDTKTLKQIYTFISGKSDHDFWNKLTREQQEEIEKALRDLDSGGGIPHEKVMEKYIGKYM